MPTPKRTPASTRFEPPSPKANVSPATTMATRERPRAMVLVNACCRTLTAFSQGEAPWAKAGPARNRAATEARIGRVERQQRRTFQPFFIPIPRQESCIAMRGKPRAHAPASPCGRNALVQRHARLTPEQLPRCVLTPLCGRKRDLRVNFPLSTYSVFEEKNVSQKLKLF